MKQPHVIVVGAGASGLAAAIAAARAGASVSVLEAAPRPGRSIMASGNGRCNFCNADLSPWRYNDPLFVQKALGDDPLADILAFFGGLGLWYQADGEGRFYPGSRAAASVLDVLLGEVEMLGVELRVDARVRTLLGGRLWTVRLESGEELAAPCVVWCAGGGSAAPIAGLSGLRATPFEKVLCPLATEPRPAKDLDGVRAVCGVEVRRGPEKVFRERGEVLFRKYGVSGIVVFDASRHALPGDAIVLDLAPGLSYEAVLDDMRRRSERAERVRDVAAARLRVLDGALHPKLARHLAERACRKGGSRPADPERLAALVKGWELRVAGREGVELGQVTRGGVDNACIDPATFECLSQPRLFVCGEALDVDGACGGLNLAWAWKSGLVAGRAAAISCTGSDL